MRGRRWLGALGRRHRRPTGRPLTKRNWISLVRVARLPKTVRRRALITPQPAHVSRVSEKSPRSSGHRLAAAWLAGRAKRRAADSGARAQEERRACLQRPRRFTGSPHTHPGRQTRNRRPSGRARAPTMRLGGAAKRAPDAPPPRRAHAPARATAALSRAHAAHAAEMGPPRAPRPRRHAAAEPLTEPCVAEFPTMPDYDISASLDLLLSKPWDDVLAENPKFKQATENWGAQTAANYKSVAKAESSPP